MCIPCILINVLRFVTKMIHASSIKCLGLYHVATLFIHLTHSSHWDRNLYWYLTLLHNAEDMKTLDHHHHRQHYHQQHQTRDGPSLIC